jgi:AAHS family 4-hydroxybenzoate transporter-like MFS transporter
MTAPAIDQVIDSRPLSGLQIGVAVACAFVVFVDGYDLQSMSLAAPSIAAEWGVEPATFSWVHSSSLLGMLLAAFVAPLGDRLGRTRVLAAGLAITGLSSIATSLGETYWQLAFWRMLTGVGLGICQANATALTSEYAPAKRRAALMTLMGCNVGVGAIVASLAAPAIIAEVGWRGVFWAGGVAPLLLAVLFLVGVPESVRLLATLKPGDARIGAIMAKIAPGASFSMPAPAPKAPWHASASAVLTLLGSDYRRYTWRLWLIWSGSSVLLYLLLSWLPVLLRGAGWGPAESLRGIAVLQLGGIAGSILLAFIVDRGRPVLALLLAFGAVALGALLFAVVPSSVLAWSLVLAFTGTGLFGATFALFAIAARFYPPNLRAAGFGWGAAVARVGAVVGPIAGGAMLASGIETKIIMALLSIPALVCVAAALTLLAVVKSEPAAPAQKLQEAVP